MSNYIISLSDITAALKASGESVDSTILADERRLKTILWNMGLDTQHKYDENYCKHRNMQGFVVECVRFEGSERSDKTWMNSGYATPRNSKFANEAQEAIMPNTSSTSSEYHLKRN